MTTATIATAPKNTTPTTFLSISGFALPSLIHKQPTSPTGFLFLKLPPPPCAALLVEVFNNESSHNNTNTNTTTNNNNNDHHHPRFPFLPYFLSPGSANSAEKVAKVSLLRQELERRRAKMAKDLEKLGETMGNNCKMRTPKKTIKTIGTW